MVSVEDTYLFIDGEYLRRIYRDAMLFIFGEEGDLDPASIRYAGRASRAFFYDCLDDSQQAGESDADFQKRLAKQESFFSGVSRISGFHFRPGTLKGERKRRRQKEVDVQLAVDMLVHGFNKNMKTALLLAGDLDFRPIVEVLVQHGVFVEIWYGPTSISTELPMAADFGRPLDLHELYGMSTTSFVASHRLPSVQWGQGMPVSPRPQKKGTVGSSEAYLFKVGQEYCLWVRDYGTNPLTVQDSNPERIERYMKMQLKPVVWN